MGVCLLLSVVHLVLFALQRSYRANLYFALFCLVWMFRTAVVGSKLLMLLFPGLPWHIAFRMEYMAIPIATMLVTLALNAMFGELLQTWARYTIVAVNTAAVLFFLFAPTVLMSQILPFVYATTLLCAVRVTTNYLLGLSDMKRSLEIQTNLEKKLDRFCDIVDAYERLTYRNQKLVCEMMTFLESQQDETE